MAFDNVSPVPNSTVVASNGFAIGYPSPDAVDGQPVSQHVTYEPGVNGAPNVQSLPPIWLISRRLRRLGQILRIWAIGTMMITVRFYQCSQCPASM